MCAAGILRTLGDAGGKKAKMSLVESPGCTWVLQIRRRHCTGAGHPQQRQRRVRGEDKVFGARQPPADGIRKSSVTDKHAPLTLQPREGFFFFQLCALLSVSLGKYISESFIRPHKDIISEGAKVSVAC